VKSRVAKAMTGLAFDIVIFVISHFLSAHHFARHTAEKCAKRWRLTAISAFFLDGTLCALFLAVFSFDKQLPLRSAIIFSRTSRE
jgi:hypothetical protein